MPDPCGSKIRFECKVAKNLKDLMLGTNYYNIKVVQEKTFCCYANVVNTMFHKCGFVMPVCWLEEGNLPAILVNNLTKEEDIACQQSPLDNRIFEAISLRTHLIASFSTCFG